MKNMTTADKVAILLTNYGFSLAEGAQIYNTTEEEGELVLIDKERDVVIWGMKENERTEGFYLTVWLNYKKDFCLNYALAGAIALDDEELNVEGEHKALLLSFFKECQDIKYYKDKPVPDLPDTLHWLFTSAATTDWVRTDEYDITDDFDIVITA